MTEVSYWAVVPAAGIGRRMQAAVPKQYLPLAGLQVISYTLNVLMQHPRISGVVVVISPDDTWWDSVVFSVTDKPVMRVLGGKERCHSVLNGLTVLQQQAQPDDWVLVHDAARPCLRDNDLDALIDVLDADPVGGLLAIPVRDTIKRADGDGQVIATVNRNGLWHALTPQMFRLGVLLSALRQAIDRHLLITDESSAIEAAGLTPRLVEGRADNIKITHPEDLALAEFYVTRGLDS